MDLGGLHILNLNGPEYNILNWLAVLAKNRSYWQNGSIAEEAKSYLQEHFYIDTEPYDVIIGYRADASYFSFAQDFVAGTISLRKLSEAMRLGKLGEQIVLKSERSYQHIRFLDAEPADAAAYYEKKAVRDREARREYRKTKQAADGIEEMYPLYHEMDISHFTEQMDALMKKASPLTKLRHRRDDCGMSQSDLAKDADVPLRQIQLFEQGQRDINKTSAVTLFKLSKALHCRMEDLLEHSSL